MNTSLSNILFILLIFQLLFLCFFLFTQQKSRLSNRLLGFFFLAICLNLLDVFLFNIGLYYTYPFLAGFGNSMLFLLGPLLYFYTRSVVHKNFRLTFTTLLHLLPFLIFFIGTEFYYLIQSREVQELILKRLTGHQLPRGFAFVSIFILLQFLLYMVLSIRVITLYKNAAKQLFSNTKYTNVSWLYSTIGFFIFIMMATTLNGLLAQTSFAKYYLLGFNFIILAVLIFVVGVLMKALRDSSFFAFAERYLTGKSAPSKNIETDGEKEKAVKEILLYMKTSKPFLEPELTLDNLAAQLSLKSKFLSQVINEHLQQNFFDFINHYRIEEAARLLTNPEDKKITILEVLYKVGFNSKSSFNTLFKKYTGLTPTEFKNKQSS
jgi:AraC-like DNA-binding protein